MRHELRQLVEHEGHCLSHLGNWVPDQLQETQEICSDHCCNILLRWTVNDGSHRYHRHISVAPVLASELRIYIRVHSRDDLCPDCASYIFECIASSNSDTVFSYVINILIVCLLVKFVETCNHNLEDTVKATLYDTLSGLASC